MLQKDDKADKEEDNNDKNTNKVPTTPVPTPSPSISPTVSPTASPTRAPVVVPWRNMTLGEIELKVSIFTYEPVQTVVSAAIGSSSSTSSISTRKLERLSAAEILNNRNNDLIERVLSSMATILCDNEQGIDILSVVNMTFYDYCKMLLDQNDDEQEQGLFNDQGGGVNDDGVIVGDGSSSSQGTIVGTTISNSSTDFEVNVMALPTNQTYLVTDLIDDDTGLLNIEDRRVFISDLSGGDGDDGNQDGDYLYWTVWSVSYPIFQYGTTVSSESQEQQQQTTVTTTATTTLDEVQATFDRLFSTAVTNGVMDKLLQEKSSSTSSSSSSSSSNDENVYVASLEGWEVETFVKALERLETTSSSNTGNNGDDDEEGRISSSQERIHVFWQPIRITGFVILGVLFLTVGLLIKVGHERYRFDAWDVAVTNDDKRSKEEQQLLQQQQQGLNVDISTCEGLDFMLHCSHQARKQSNLLLARSSSHPLEPSINNDVLPTMNMGNTLSEIAGPPVKSDLAAGAHNMEDTSTPRPSPARVMRSTLLKSLGGLDKYKDYNDAECIGNGEYALVSVKSKTNRPSSFVQQVDSKSTRTHSSAKPRPLLPSSANSVSSHSSHDDDELLFKNQSIEPFTPKRNGGGGGNGNNKPQDVATPENAERVRMRDGNEYAFISVSSKSSNHK